MSLPALRDMPIITATLEGSRWRIVLPSGEVTAPDEAAVLRIVHDEGCGSAIRWLIPAAPERESTASLTAASEPGQIGAGL